MGKIARALAKMKRKEKEKIPGLKLSYGYRPPAKKAFKAKPIDVQALVALQEANRSN